MSKIGEWSIIHFQNVFGSNVPYFSDQPCYILTKELVYVPPYFDHAVGMLVEARYISSRDKCYQFVESPIETCTKENVAKPLFEMIEVLNSQAPKICPACGKV